MNKKVVVIGDVMADLYLRGESRRLSPETGAPVLNRTAEILAPGGAANVAANVAALTARDVQVVLVGAVGRDQVGDQLTWDLTRRGVDFFGSREPVTRTRTRLVNDRGQTLARIDNDDQVVDNFAVPTALQALLSGANLILLSDYNKGVLSEQLVQEIQRFANTEEVPVLVDPKGLNWGRYDRVSAITPNWAEAGRFVYVDSFNLDPASDEHASDLVRRVRGRLHAENIIVKRGGHGATLLTHIGSGDPHVSHVRTRLQQVADVTGAGDSFLAGLASGLLDGMTYVEAVQRANLVAGVAVSLPGTVVVTKMDLHQALLNRSGTMKILTLSEAERVAQAARMAGRSLVFTNGVFDLFHPGHLHLLEQARVCGDVLIVGLNDDASARALSKGEGRPYYNWLQRAEMVGALWCVDAVVPFHDPTPVELIRKLAPDVLVKGAAYSMAEIEGADLVVARGGKVVRVPMRPGQSTTKLVRVIRGEVQPEEPDV